MDITKYIFFLPFGSFYFAMGFFASKLLTIEGSNYSPFVSYATILSLLVFSNFVFHFNAYQHQLDLTLLGISGSIVLFLVGDAIGRRVDFC